MPPSATSFPFVVHISINKIVFLHGRNNTIAQSEYNEKIEEYYEKRDEISRRDEHLFSKSLEEELLQARLSQNYDF